MIDKLTFPYYGRPFYSGFSCLKYQLNISTYRIFSYHPPTGTDTEKVVIREMLNANDPVKNMILSMSDLHLDCDWSKGMHDRLLEFMTKLASVTEVLRI